MRNLSRPSLELNLGIIGFLLLAIGADAKAAEGIEAEAAKREPATAKQKLKLAAEHKG